MCGGPLKRSLRRAAARQKRKTFKYRKGVEIVYQEGISKRWWHWRILPSHYLVESQGSLLLEDSAIYSASYVSRSHIFVETTGGLLLPLLKSAALSSIKAERYCYNRQKYSNSFHFNFIICFLLQLLKTYIWYPIQDSNLRSTGWKPVVLSR